jgi:HPt (histidine-containing phosphotransfer) domain-containing protein
MAETGRDRAFCAHTILTPDQPLVVPDAVPTSGSPTIPSSPAPPHPVLCRCAAGHPRRSRDPDAIAALRELERADAPGFLAELIGLFVDDLPRRLEAIANGIAQADSAAIVAAAHSLKGSAANLGARPLAALCQQLEAAGKAGSLEGAELLLDAIRTESTVARTRLEQEIRPAA